MQGTSKQAGFVSALLRQFFTAICQAISICKTDINGAFSWIYVRNAVSLRSDSNRAAQI